MGQCGTIGLHLKFWEVSNWTDCDVHVNSFTRAATDYVIDTSSRLSKSGPTTPTTPATCDVLPCSNRRDSEPSARV
jgi:hypothetical protein